jgi:hypothetical protein
MLRNVRTQTVMVMSSGIIVDHIVTATPESYLAMSVLYRKISRTQDIGIVRIILTVVE